MTRAPLLPSRRSSRRAVGRRRPRRDLSRSQSRGRGLSRRRERSWTLALASQCAAGWADGQRAARLRAARPAHRAASGRSVADSCRRVGARAHAGCRGDRCLACVRRAKHGAATRSCHRAGACPTTVSARSWPSRDPALALAPGACQSGRRSSARRVLMLDVDRPRRGAMGSAGGA